MKAKAAVLFLVLILSASSVPAAETVLVFAPVATGTVRFLPYLDILERAPVGDDIQSTCFQTTSTNLELRRGFIEFDVPRLKRVVSATLHLQETRGTTSFPFPPETHELSFYEADGKVDTDDFDAKTHDLTTFDTDVNDPTQAFALDVTKAVSTGNRAVVGFRIKLAVEGCSSFSGSALGGPSVLPPVLEVVVGDALTGALGRANAAVRKTAGSVRRARVGARE